MLITWWSHSNGDKCQNGGEIFFLDLAHGKFLLYVGDNFTQNHPDAWCLKVTNSATKAFKGKS